jgi:hypothetical protein
MCPLGAVANDTAVRAGTPEITVTNMAQDREDEPDRQDYRMSEISQ